jgi:LacI family transcriptional regulator
LVVDSPPTIYDVAARAGVSTATVSRALNSLSSVRPATRDKVLAAMEELEFVPNVVARGLSSGKHWIIGLVFTRAVIDPSNHAVDDFGPLVEEASLLYTDIVIRGAEVRAAEHGYSLLLSSADERHPSGITSLINLTGAVDGLILLDRVVKDDDVAYLARRIPVVLLAGRGDLDSAITVRVDNEQAMRSLVEHLSKVHGVNRFGFVTGANESPDSVSRAAAVRQFVAEFGGSLGDVDCLQADWTSSGGELAMLARMKDPAALPEAFICANDQTAVGVIFALRTGGLRVPEDLAITGFDDISLTRYFSPTLTTIRQSGRILGEVAIDALVAMLDDSRVTQRTIVLPTELIVRESCGCVEDTKSVAKVAGALHAQRSG